MAQTPYIYYMQPPSAPPQVVLHQPVPESIPKELSEFPKEITVKLVSPPQFQTGLSRYIIMFTRSLLSMPSIRKKCRTSYRKRMLLKLLLLLYRMRSLQSRTI